MDQKIVYSKTGKGVLEIKNKAGKLSRELAKVLGLVDGKSSVADLIAKSKLSDADVGRVLKQLEDRGFIKEFSNLSGAMSSASSVGSSSYVDDLDFTSQLSPGKRIYSSSQAEMRQRESADREQAESEAKRKRDQAEQQKKNQATKQAREEAARLARIEAERKAKEAAAVKAKQEADRKKKQQEEEMEKTTRDLAKILEAERQALEKSSRQKKEDQARKAKEDAERRARDEAESKKREAEDRKLREAEERKRRDEEEQRKRREAEERKRREEEDRKRREEEDRRRREEEERKRREEEDRKRREEEERKRREEEDRKRREEEERRRREEEEERARREEEERRRREEEDRRREEEDRRREEEDRRREEEERERRGEEEPAFKEEESEAPSFDFGSFDLPSDSGSDESSMSSFDSPGATSAVERYAEDSFDGPSFDAESSAGFAADFDRQQEALRKQEAEEERRRKKAEDELAAQERARREEEAREEAVRRSAMEAEMRTRVEQEKAERAERERAKEEEYKRKIEQEEERKRAEAEKREREEFQKTEAERKKREEDLARRRQQSEEADRKRAEIKALQKRGRIRSPVERARPLIIGVVVVVALLVGGIQVIPMTGFIPGVEKMVSNNLGEPVTIGSMKMSVLSGLQFKLGSVNVGTTQDVTLSEVTVTPELGSLFGNKLVLSSVSAEGGTIVKEALARFPGWLSTSVSDQRMDVRAISLRSIKLEMRTFQAPSLNADVVFGRDGTISSATVTTVDRKLSVGIDNFNSQGEVTITATNWSPPIGAPFQLTDFSGKGVLSGSTIRLNEWEGMAYGGQAKGTAEISWGSRWRLSSQFEFARIETEELLGVFSDTAKVSGSASGKGSFVAQAGTLDAMFDRPSLDASFIIKKGAVDGVDLVRALQAGRAGTQGGSTRFEELTGNVSVGNGRFSYRDVELAAGILSAQSDFTISDNSAVSGRVNVALRSPSQRLSASMNISGSLKGISLRP